MTTYDSAALQTAVTHERIDFTERDARALTECMTVLDDVGRARGADHLYLVVSESGSEYLVDLRAHTCECPDAEHRDVLCKHGRRAAFATGRREIPAWVNRDAVDAKLADQVDTTPRQAATDGGIIVAGDDAEILDESENESEDEDCDCYGLDDDLECWECAYSDEEGE